MLSALQKRLFAPTRQGETLPSDPLLLIDLFGPKYVKVVRKQLPDVRTQRLFDQTHAAMLEIQRQIEQGVGSYSDESHPWTFQVLREAPASINRIAMFELLKAKSYVLLPFPQKRLLESDPEHLRAVQELEAVRSAGLQTLIRGLTDKGCSELLSSQEDQFNVLKLYFRGGALIYDQRIVYFSEMVCMWCANLEHALIVSKFLGNLPYNSFVKCEYEPILDLIQLTQSETLSFEEFLLLSSLMTLEKNIGCEFLPSVKRELAKGFIKSEAIRSDLCYFSADLNVFSTFDFEAKQRESAPLIRSFQIFFILSPHISQVEHPTLLIILLFMNKGAFSSFSNRPLDAEKTATFKSAWTALYRSLSAVSRVGISFSAPSPEAEELLSTRHCWDLLLFLWKNEQRVLFSTTLQELRRMDNFSMTLSETLEFCQANQETLTEQKSAMIIENYRVILGALQDYGRVLREPQHLFCKPPLVIPQDMLDCRQLTQIFLEEMEPYRFTKEVPFCWMLRQFILSPQRFNFRLLEDCKEVGVDVNEELLLEALTKAAHLFDPEPELETRKRAIGLTTKIQERYQFSSTQVFSLYVEVLRLCVQGNESVIGKMSEVVHRLVDFCPALQRETIYCFFRYHPDVAPDQVTQFVQKRAQWANNEEQLRRFVIEPTLYRSIIEMINGFAAPLAELSCDDGGKFFVGCQRALLSAFFPPLQPLIDYFRITDVTLEGIRWGEPIWKTHEGQLKFILKNAGVGAYFNWSIFGDRVVFFMSFYNMRSHSARSAFIPLQNPIQEIAPIRGLYWGLLVMITQQVLREESDHEIAPDAPEAPESWIGAYMGAEETLRDFKDVPIDWDFLRRVKLSYRNLFLSSVAERELDDFPSYDPLYVAGCGHIFSSDTHPRGALLPPSILELQTEPEHFIPEANEEFVEEIRQLFQNSTPTPTPLNLALLTKKGKFPIGYHVQTADEFVHCSVDATQNERAPPSTELDGKYVILSTDKVHIPLRYPPEALDNRSRFLQYFDYHILILKANTYAYDE